MKRHLTQFVTAGLHLGPGQRNPARQSGANGGQPGVGRGQLGAGRGQLGATKRGYGAAPCQQRLGRTLRQGVPVMIGHPRDQTKESPHDRWFVGGTGGRVDGRAARNVE